MAENNNQNWLQRNSGIVGTVAGAAGGLLGMIGQNSRARKQHERQQELMGIQFKNQSQLNQQGHELQKKMWEDTNYPAQMKMMREAGLNPGLMYGMSGGGATTTGSQGGGSAASGNAAAPMDIGQALQAGMMKAQIDNINADTELKKEQAPKETEIGKAQYLENVIKQFDIETTGEGWALRIAEHTKYGDVGISTNGIQYKQKVEKLNNTTERNKILAQELENLGVQKTAIEAGINLTKEQERQIYHKIIQDWAKTGIQAINTIQLKGIIDKVIGTKPNNKKSIKEINAQTRKNLNK